MNRAAALALLFGVLLNMCSHAEEPRVTRPRWVIILTITDRATGAQVEQGELDHQLHFDDPVHCKSIVAEVGQIPPTDHLVAVLTCRKLAPAERNP